MASWRTQSQGSRDNSSPPTHRDGALGGHPDPLAALRAAFAAFINVPGGRNQAVLVTSDAASGFRIDSQVGLAAGSPAAGCVNTLVSEVARLIRETPATQPEQVSRRPV